MNIKIPDGSVLKDPVTVGGYKFFYENGNIMCATCLMMIARLGDPEIPKQMGKVRDLVLQKNCDCSKQI